MQQVTMSIIYDEISASASASSMTLRLTNLYNVKSDLNGPFCTCHKPLYNFLNIFFSSLLRLREVVIIRHGTGPPNVLRPSFHRFCCGACPRQPWGYGGGFATSVSKLNTDFLVL